MISLPNDPMIMLSVINMTIAMMRKRISSYNGIMEG